MVADARRIVLSLSALAATLLLTAAPAVALPERPEPATLVQLVPARAGDTPTVLLRRLGYTAREVALALRATGTAPARRLAAGQPVRLELAPAGGPGRYRLVAVDVDRPAPARPAATPRLSGVATVLAHPLPDGALRSGFGWRTHPILGGRRFHRGVDLAAPRGTPVHAVADGIVLAAGPKGAYGRQVRLAHADGVETSYAHLSVIAAGIEPGAAVRRGEVIGQVGRTGRATGPHLCFELLLAGRAIDPLSVTYDRAASLARRDPPRGEPSALAALLRPEER